MAPDYHRLSFNLKSFTTHHSTWFKVWAAANHIEPLEWMKCLWVPILENNDDNWGWVAKHALFKDGDIVILRQASSPHQLIALRMPVEDEEEPFNYHFCEVLGVEELSAIIEASTMEGLFCDILLAACIGRTEGNTLSNHGFYIIE